MPQINRRQFIKSSAAAGALAAFPSLLPSTSRGADAAASPSNRITVGLIGHGCMGAGHLRRLVGDPSIQVLAVCDVDRIRRDAARSIVDATYGAASASGNYRACSAYVDYRELLARPDIDAVVIVTPDHWHSLQSIDAAKAGKDVYCEKPISVTIEEGRRVVQTVRRYSRVFQTGSQYRSIPTIRRICQFVRDGGLGRVKQVFTLLDPVYYFIKSERFRAVQQAMDVERFARAYTPTDFALPPEPVPDGLDWEMWVGPAPWRDYNSVYHINPVPGVVPWSFDQAFGVVSLTWHLSHSTDVLQYAIGMEQSGPVELIHPDTGQFPTLTCRYANGTLLHFVDHWGMVRDVYKAVSPAARLAGNFGAVFVGERGWVTSMSTGGPVEGEPESLFREMGLITRQVNIGANNHHANWFDCIRTRKLPSNHEEIGHRSASLGHLAMISYRLRRSLKWDPVKEEFDSDEAANRLRSRAMRQPWRM